MQFTTVILYRKKLNWTELRHFWIIPWNKMLAKFFIYFFKPNGNILVFPEDYLQNINKKLDGSQLETNDPLWNPAITNSVYCVMWGSLVPFCFTSSRRRKSACELKLFRHVRNNLLRGNLKQNETNDLQMSLSDMY